jgi:hypothetical protein
MTSNWNNFVLSLISDACNFRSFSKTIFSHSYKGNWQNYCEKNVKVKGEIPYALTGNHAMKAYWGEWRYTSTHSLTLALAGGEWSATRPGRFTLRERAPGTHWIGGWWAPEQVWTRW